LKASAVVKRHAINAQKQGMLFNIFEVLDRGTDEEKGHSAFIAALLDPRGPHGQGTRYLKLFLEMLNEEARTTASSPSGDGETMTAYNAFSPLDPESNWRVHCEAATNENRRIDILLQSERQVVVIENKIYAGDQELQLQSYTEFARNLNKGKPWVVYLTLDGSDPSGWSRGELKESDFICLSYQFNIDNWIEACQEASVELPHIRETLYQYKQLIRKLTNRSHAMQSVKELKELIINGHYIDTTIELEKALTEVRIQGHWQFWTEMKKKLEKYEPYKRSRIQHKEATEEWVRKFYTQAKNNRYFGLGFKIADVPGHNDLYVIAEMKVEHSLYFDFNLLQGTGKEEKLIDKKKIRAEFKESYETILKNMNYIVKDTPLGWRYPTKRLEFAAAEKGWQQMLDEKIGNSVVEGIFNEFTNDAEMFLKKLQGY